MAKTEKPLLFGSAQLDSKALEDIARFEDAGFDNSYVPGYSEQRMANELRVRDREKPIDMDRLYWARVSRADGSDVDYREAVTVAKLGYRPCTLDDLKERGWGMPPAAHVAADGTIRREDTALAIVDFDRAETNKTRQRDANAAFEGKDTSTEHVQSKLEKSSQGVSLRDAAARVSLAK